MISQTLKYYITVRSESQVLLQIISIFRPSARFLQALYFYILRRQRPP